MEELSPTEETLVEKATAALKNAYAPYSNFRVGAALLSRDGNIYTGCNVENAAYGSTICAERTAIFKAISEGEKEFSTIAIVLETDDGIGSPCGACRQVMNEFNAEMKIIMANTAGDYKVSNVEELLPDSFGANYLENREIVRPEP
ncbi:MAG: cytidine deaminase [bacterium]